MAEYSRKKAKFVSREMVRKAREMDLYTYMEIYEPDNLVRVCAGTYQLREHDSVKISNGLWVQKSTGIGGRSALDYLVKVRGISFQDAVEQLSGMSAPERKFAPREEQRQPKVFQLPPRNKTNDRVVSYLNSRGISAEIVQYCIDRGLLFESGVYHNAVFVGFDYDGMTPKYATQRGCGSDFRGEAAGSDKRFGFRMEAESSQILHVFEAPIDLLSYAQLMVLHRQDWKKVNLLALGGVAPRKDGGLPIALETYLQHRKIEAVYLHLDNDEAGCNAADAIISALAGSVLVIDSPPTSGKDVNDFLCSTLGIVQKPSR